MSEREIIVLDTAEQLFVRAAEEILHIAGEAICTHGEFRVCLAGGTTPARTYEMLAKTFRGNIDWKEVQFYWGDERCVPPDDPASNFGMAIRTMLSHLDVKPAQIHRIKGELAPSEAAREYEDELRESFGIDPGDVPRFDLMLLGLGENRHIASLFPGQASIHEQERLVLAVEVDDPHRDRITLTPRVINNSARVMFVVSGEAKAAAVHDVIEGADDPERAPAKIVSPADGVVMWLLDAAAASRLSKR
ncbi:MAG TPA: 6-phosphogluconolactonase [Candidatus Binataceae bacterium]|nr:6-phosphogluconolactonase [Candidatus Binataceae bacterium]